MHTKRKWLVTTVIICFVLTTVLIGKRTIGTVNAQSSYEDLKTFVEILSLIKKDYVDEVKTKALLESAIKGMVSSLDPHSAYMSPEEYKELQVETKGEFGGLGIEIGVKDNVITVIAPIEDTPAVQGGN